MPLNAQATVRRAVEILQDTTSVRWPLNEIVRWLNDGQREIILYRPDAMVTNQTLTCATGSRQTIAGLNPPGAKLIEVVRNNSATSKRAIRDINREVLDASSPGWHSLTPVSEVLHFMFDERDPRTFYVYPPATTSAAVDVVYSALPTDVPEPALGASLPTSSQQDLGTSASFTATLTKTPTAPTGVTGYFAGNNFVCTAATTTATAVLQPGDTLAGTGVAAGTKILGLISGTSGGVGTYSTNVNQTVGTSSAPVSITVTKDSTLSLMNVTAVASGTVNVGALISYTGATNGATITGSVAASTGIGFYSISASGAQIAADVASGTTVTTGPTVILGTLSIPDIFANTLLDYMLYRAYLKDSEYAGNAQRAQAHYGAFATALGIEIKSTMANSPNMSNSVKNPNNPRQAVQAAQ